jgi:serine/threonine protein kinase
MIGSVVSHYRVLDRLGAGGMGVVYRAEDLRLGRHVAMKFLPESATADPLATERFQREARTTSALNHPNICTLHDVGEHEGRRFIVMELIDGATLDKVLGAGALPVDRVIDISATVADALDAAHTEGILHRDIKPGNIFISKRGQVKVVDFGLAKIMPQRGLTPVEVTIAEQHPLTSAGMAVGTVAYMSPEHARGEAIDPRSDLFSLGVVMYEMATGVQTFKGQTTAVIFDQILNRVPVPPSRLNPDVIPALEHIIGRLLEKDRERRYQSARDVQADLHRLKRDLDARRIVAADAAQTSPPPLTWTPPAGHPSHAQTMAVNVPTYGVEADPAPVPAAWAHDWEQSRPSSRPDHDPAEPRHAPRSEPLRPEPSHARPAAAAARSAHAVALESGPIPAAMPSSVSPSAPTVVVPASGSSRAATPGPPPLPAAPETPDAPFEDVLAYVPHAPDAETHLASERRESAEHRIEEAADAADAPVSVPAVWTTPATTRPRQGLNTRGLAVASATALTLSLAAGGVWWMLQGREVAVSGATTDTPAPPPAPAPAPPPVAAPVEPTADPFNASTPPATPDSAAATPGRSATPGRTAPAANANAAVPTATKPGATPTATPPSTARPNSRAAFQASVLLSEAQGLIQTGNESEGLAKIGALRATFGGTPAARDGALLAARTHQNAKRYDDAAAVWIDSAKDGVGAEDISEGLIQAADGAARLRTADGDVLARRTLGEILDRYPASVRALRALQMKMSLEDRMKLKEPDTELRGTAPSSLLTLRKVAREGGTAPAAEFALWRLGQEYRDRRLYDLAAQAFADLGTRFPATRYDAWFSAAELYEKQLKDAARARDAYGKVPQASPKYEAAQKKLS